MIADIIRFFREIDLNELLTSDYGGAWDTIVGVVRDPQGNIMLAIVLFALVTLLASIIFAVLLLFITGADDDDEQEADAGESAAARRVAPTSAPGQPVAPPRSRYVTAAVWMLFLALVWVGTGWATSSDAVCIGCHAKTIHTAAVGADASAGPKPHQHVRCVSCHESASVVRRYGWGTVPRAAHFVTALASTRGDEYGIVGSQACLSCHSVVIKQVVTNTARGLITSHREPFEAGWECLDCHSVEAGDIGPTAGGMTRCVSCHNGKTAPTDCETCHTGDISVATGSAQDGAREPRELVVVDCGGCHANQEKTCDPCHGIRMPHSGAFIAGGHARDYAVSLWYGDGQACTKCHTDTRRPCSGCHQGRFPGHAKTWGKDHQSASPTTDGCTGCHTGTKGTRPQRNICIDLCHTDHEEWR